MQEIQIPWQPLLRGLRQKIRGQFVNAQSSARHIFGVFRNRLGTTAWLAKHHDVMSTTSIGSRQGHHNPLNSAIGPRWQDGLVK
jgi:hypothetical protein